MKQKLDLVDIPHGTEYGVAAHKGRLAGYTYTLSYGGGTNSTALLIEIVKRGLPLDYVIFADVGFEHPETYEFVYGEFMKWCVKNNIRFCVVTAYVKKKRMAILEFFNRYHRIPDQIFRDCTTHQKVKPIHKFYERQLKAEKIIEYIGIHAGEKRRVKRSRTDWVTKCYPLYEWDIDQAKCLEIIKDAGLPIPPKSGCPNCFAHSKKEYFELYKKHPDLFETAIKIEKNYLDHKIEEGKKFYYYLRFNGKPTPLEELKKEFESMTKSSVIVPHTKR